MNNRVHQGQPVLAAGKPMQEAEAVMILVHGRGATASSILELSKDIYHPNIAYLAPQAAQNTWYPYSFLEELQHNQPGLDSGLQVLGDLVDHVIDTGIGIDKIIVGGFSQGSCLACEYVARNAQRFGGLFVFSGGLIGPPGTVRDYEGNFDGMPMFIGCSDVDFHIPEERVRETADVYRNMGAIVTERIYPGMGHTVNQDEIDEANKIVATVLGQ